MKIFIINGSGGVGKDTFKDYIKELYISQNKGDYFSYSIINPIKHIANIIGWNGDKELSDRKALSDLKDLSAQWTDYPFKATCEYIDKIISESQFNPILFLDVRDPFDINRFKELYDVTTILVERPNLRIKKYGNHADDNVNDYQYDYYIENSAGLPDFRLKAERLFTQIFGG